MYIRFFNGRKDPNEDTDGCGFDGPVIGPVRVCWIYGKIRLEEITDNVVTDGFEWVPVFEDMVWLDAYYGDFELLRNCPAHIPGERWDYKRFESVAQLNNTVPMTVRAITNVSTDDLLEELKRRGKDTPLSHKQELVLGHISKIEGLVSEQVDKFWGQRGTEDFEKISSLQNELLNIKCLLGFLQ